MAVSLEKSPVAHKRAEWNALAREVGHHRFGETVELAGAYVFHAIGCRLNWKGRPLLVLRNAA